MKRKLALFTLLAMTLAASVMAAPGDPPAKPSPKAPAKQLKGAVPPPKTPAERQERIANRQKHQKAMQDFLKANPKEQQKTTEERKKHQKEMQDSFKVLNETKDPAARKQLIKAQQEKIQAHYRQMQEQMARLAASQKK